METGVARIKVDPEAVAEKNKKINDYRRIINWKSVHVLSETGGKTCTISSYAKNFSSGMRFFVDVHNSNISTAQRPKHILISHQFPTEKIE
ncbi:hypothetical protein BsIDN1_51160 [Bacillus safensis]|uniref:Uncharacterized protein n=1 Tax=Bacillus safensis TaxID=561879 RepID=A0A5S9MEQ4_BACIA|nr:hypothetical protein BsIDN1_51160 [Bacillus safensis]